MISDESVESAVDYLRDNASKAAKAKAERIYAEEYRDVVKSQIMREFDDLGVGVQERNAKADTRYAQHLKAIREAVEADEYHRWMMKAAEAKINAWQTQSANNRGLERLR